MHFSQAFLSACCEAAKQIDSGEIEQLVLALAQIRENQGRLFIAGSGGGAGHASHAVCDFRKLCGIDAYAPYDNVSELTARVNDEGWATSLSESLTVSKLTDKDGLLFFSVGGGDEERQISANLINACKHARGAGARVFAIVGRDGGYLRKQADVSVLVPVVDAGLVTPITEGLQAVVWHLLVSHPHLQKNPAKWESQTTGSQPATQSGRSPKTADVGDCDRQVKAAELLKQMDEAARQVNTSLRIKVFADGASIEHMRNRANDPLIKGFTTNPTLMRKSGVSDYVGFARAALEAIPDKPICFEVFSDDFGEMEQQALEIAGWGKNVYVKVPITNTKGESALPLIERLVEQAVPLNVTAVTHWRQVEPLVSALAKGKPCIVSIFAGRIADTGRDPVPIVARCLEMVRPYPNIELLWASPREIYNLIQADSLGCHIITITEDILKKLSILNVDLLKMSLDTVEMFYRDAQAAGYSIARKEREKAI